MEDNVSNNSQMIEEAKSNFMTTILNAFSPIIKALSTFLIFAMYPASPVIFIIGMTIKVISWIFGKIIQL